MLLNPMAVKKLYEVTKPYWPYMTHQRRNELAQMFLEEAGRLLDQNAESAIKHAVERYVKEEISYEQYIELVEQVSREEAERGASYGRESARNRVFDFAQKALDQAKNRAYALSLVDAKKQFEIEKQKTEQSIKDSMQQYVAVLETKVQQCDSDLRAITQQQKEDLVHDQEGIIERTRTEIEQVLLKHLQDERDRREREIHEQEALRPAREAVRTAMAHVALLERKVRSHRMRKWGLAGLGVSVFLLLVILLLFFPLPQWIILLLLVALVAILATVSFWKSAVSEEKIMENKRQIALFQAGAGEYGPLSEEERCALLVQRIS